MACAAIVQRRKGGVKLLSERRDLTEPRADRGPQAGSPLEVVVATGSYIQSAIYNSPQAQRRPGGGSVLGSGRYRSRFFNARRPCAVTRVRAILNRHRATASCFPIIASRLRQPLSN